MKDFTTEELQDLIWDISRKQYNADKKIPKALEICASLLQLDYNLVQIENESGVLSSHYPSCIFVPESEKPRGGSSPSVIYEQPNFDAAKLRELCLGARSARCRTRFPVPVILYGGKYICRSATLSGGAEIYLRNGYDFLYGSSNDEQDNEGSDDDEAIEVLEDNGSDCASNIGVKRDWAYINVVRQNDKKLIKFMKVRTIVDFMVENKKKKFGFNVTSSEKIDKENRYSQFNIICLPYPGCEFFKLYKASGYEPENLKFNWQQNYVDAKIYVPQDSTALNIDWAQYQNWDIVQITQNYVKLILKNLRENSDGILVHCISGWDRTPLFIALLRILLWADGAIHQSLSVNQMLYFTLAYDWFFFGHNMPNRIWKGEDILFFCYDVLKYFLGDEYSMNTSETNQTTNTSRSKDSASSSTGKSVCVAGTDTVNDEENMVCQFENPGSNLSLNSCEGARSRTNSSSQSEVFTDCSNGNFSFLISQDSNGSASSVENGNSSSTATACLPRTSPVSVPTNARNRMRNESFSSMNSWHVITSSGSSLKDPGSKRNINANSEESTTTTDFDDIAAKNVANVERLQRLCLIRNTFRNIYMAKISTQQQSSVFTNIFKL